VCVKAHELTTANPAEQGPARLADLFCRQAKRRIAQRFDDVFRNDDVRAYRIAQEVLEGRHAWLEERLPE
jgi:hypothetical protein